MGEQETGNDHDQEECPADQGENPDEFAAVAWVFPDIDAVVDHRSQGTDQGTETGSVRAIDQPGKVLRKGIEHDAGRNVGNDLADADGPPVFISCHSLLQHPGNFLIGRNGRRKNKEKWIKKQM